MYIDNLKKCVCLKMRKGQYWVVLVILYIGVMLDLLDCSGIHVRRYPNVGSVV